VSAAHEPAYQRLGVDERRRRLLALGTELFTEHGYEELSMARIARAAGVSKALLYHYFPSKEAYFRETLAQVAAELQELTADDADRPAAEQLDAALGRYLAWIEEHETAYRKLLRSVGAVPEVRELVEEVRSITADRIVAGLPLADPRPTTLRVAVLGWVWFVDGAVLEWLDTRTASRDELKGLLLGALLGAVTAAGGRLGRAGGSLPA